MATHIKIVAWLNIVFGLFGAVAALTVLGATAIGAGFAGSLTNMAIVGLTGAVLGIVLGGMSVLQLVAGWGLLTRRPWARVLTIVLGVISLIRFPFGTILGVYTLWVLLSKDGAAQFGVTWRDVNEGERQSVCAFADGDRCPSETLDVSVSTSTSTSTSTSISTSSVTPT
jgi:Predicted membrane protein (DUF2127)